ncbi:MAG: hypothetical protein SVC26_08540 [Pseudomonadota bacterium]|nr:hypothetical protein [Pseudomonadota bacterium]
MDHFLSHFWFYGVIAVLAGFFFLGKRSNSSITEKLVAEFEVKNPQFKLSGFRARYVKFGDESPDRIDVELSQLPLDVAEILDLQVNGQAMVSLRVKPNHQAEFDYWRDENVGFPVLNANDALDILYRGEVIASGVFQRRG